MGDKTKTETQKRKKIAFKDKGCQTGNVEGITLEDLTAEGNEHGEPCLI